MSVEKVLQVHSAELTNHAARLDGDGEARPDSCKHGHPRIEGRCLDCAAASNRRSGQRRRERQRQARRLAGDQPNGHGGRGGPPA